MSLINSTSSSIGGINSSTEQQIATTEEVSSTANKLNGLVEDLRRELDRFKA